MRDEFKITLTVIAEMLSSQTGKSYDVHEIEILIFGWLRHPKFKCLSRETLRLREVRDGYKWLKPEEIASLFIYAGYPLT